MRIDITKVTPYKDTYLGFTEMDNIPKKGDIIRFMMLTYKVLSVRNNSVRVKKW